MQLLFQLIGHRATSRSLVLTFSRSRCLVFGLFLSLGQPLPDGGALLPVQGHGGELLEGRLELVLVLRLEEHIVVRGLGVWGPFSGHSRCRTSSPPRKTP